MKQNDITDLPSINLSRVENIYNIYTDNNLVVLKYKHNINKNYILKNYEIKFLNDKSVKIIFAFPLRSM